MSEVFRGAVRRLSRVSGVRGALVVEAAAGVPIVAELADDVSGTAVAALAASLYRRTREAARAAGYGALHTMHLEAVGGHVVVVGAGDLIVVVVTEPAAQLGLVRLEAQRAAEALS